MTEIFDRLNSYIYEINYSKRLNIDNLSFDEIVEMILSANERERQEIMESLKGELKEKIDAMVDGGLI